jgi:phosphatidate cytidylyltransferase
MLVVCWQIVESVAAGGFFASGFKRAIRVKDFGQSIPGHGGVTDRFDCQMLMAVFAYLYFHFYVARDGQEVELIDHLLDLGKYAKARVFVKVGEMLVAEGLLAVDAFEALVNSSALAPARPAFPVGG